MNTIYMIDFIRILQSISINRTPEISRKIKQYRILEFFVRELELQFCVKENIEKYLKKVAKIKEVESKAIRTEGKQSGKKKIPSLNLAGDHFTKHKTVEEQDSDKNQKPTSKIKQLIPSLKLPPNKSDRKETQESGKTQKNPSKNYLDDLLEEIADKPKKQKINQFNLNLNLNLQLSKLNKI